DRERTGGPAGGFSEPRATQRVGIEWARRGSSLMPMDDKRERFEAQVMPHLDAAYRFARWLSRSPADADDVVQEAYLRAFRGFDRLRGSDVKAWLLTIVRNCHASAHRQQQRRAAVALPGEDDEPAGSALPAPGPDPESASIGADEQRTLERLIAALPDEHREVLLLRARIGRALDEEAGAPRAATRALRARRTRPFWLGALGSLGAALAAGAAVLLLMPVRPDPMLDEIVTAHVRSLMPEHLTDVVS